MGIVRLSCLAMGARSRRREEALECAAAVDTDGGSVGGKGKVVCICDSRPLICCC